LSNTWTSIEKVLLLISNKPCGDGEKGKGGGEKGRAERIKGGL
jgi:hypothetical protein